jgi:tRNA A37 threonylcarbamoyladenosine modification protein TsaB
MKLLAIESSTSLCSVALTDNAVLRERSVNAVGLHSSVLFAQFRNYLLSQN